MGPDKSYGGRMIFPDPKPGKARRSRKYITWVATKPCLFCGAQSGPCHHVRWAGPCGGSQKPGDTYIIPICPKCHDSVHSMSGPRYQEIVHRVGREEILSAMLDNADEYMREKGI